MKRVKIEEFLSSNRVRDDVEGYLRQGGVVIYPTDTLYGMGVDIRVAGAVENLMRLKGRESGRPVPLFIDSAVGIEDICAPLSPLGKKLSEVFWPGKLTIVTRARRHVALIVGSEDGTVGVRLPDSAVSLSLAGMCGGVTTGTSANKSRGAVPLTTGQVMGDFEGDEVLFIDGKDLPPSAGSTVVRVDGNVLRILREGDVKANEILKIAEEFDNG
ncbi:MAG: threonylcarbamoyl-AMP synthase [Deltaproteobacteria bacterium]|nr:threonylcarbamoyl-AMP synthase [Deltaproteobacteria bacterium]NIS77564.1 threonylcarbamoyl-AMP synthase [Deltaproteobacteria bacterium]